MSAAANDDVLSLPDAAACLHMHPVTLRNVMNSKGRKPPGEKIGGRWKFYRPGLLAYLAGTPIHAHNWRERRQKARVVDASYRPSKPLPDWGVSCAGAQEGAGDWA